MISLAGQWTQNPSASPLQPIKWNTSFWIVFTSDDQPGWLMDSNPICHLSPAKNMKFSSLDYIQLLMIGRTGRWTQTPSATPLQPKTWNAHFCITFNFWCWPDLSMDSNPIHHPSPAKNMKCSFLYYIQLLMIGWAGRWTQTPFTTPLQPIKWNAHFWITFTLDDRPGWSMDSNPIHHSSPANKMKCSFLDYIQLLMISQAGQWNRTPSASPLQPIKMKCYFLDYIQLLMIGRAGQWTQISSSTSLQPQKRNAHFWITFNFWWSAGLVNGLEPHPPPVSCQKNEMLIFWLCSLQMIGWAGQWTRTPSTTLLQPKKWNPHFCIMLNFWCWPDWSMDSNPIHHPSPGKKMKCSYFDYVQLLMTGQAGQWTQKKMKCSFLDYVQLLMLARLVNRLEPHPPSLSSQKNEMLIFGLHSTSDDWPGWTMDSNPIHHPSPANKMKSLFLYYVELLMISRAGWWTQTPSANPLQPKKWNPHFWILFNFWWSARLVIGLEP